MQVLVQRKAERQLQPKTTQEGIEPMMTAKRIVNYMAAEPFRPFRINLASGKTYEIRHPEMVQVGRTTMTVFTWMSDDDEEAKEHEQELSLILIESIEPLDTSLTQDQN
jgi:hypothetical protein